MGGRQAEAARLNHCSLQLQINAEEEAVPDARCKICAIKCVWLVLALGKWVGMGSQVHNAFGLYPCYRGHNFIYIYIYITQMHAPSRPVSVDLRPCGHTLCSECAAKVRQGVAREGNAP